MAGYIGTTPVPQATQHRESFTATGGQTSFATAGYTPQFIDVYLNGVKLAPADYTATNGSDVVLASGATASDILEIVAYTPFEVANQTFTGDTSVTNLAVTGTFTSRGIDDNADAVAITIDSSENVGIGTSSPNSYSSQTTLTINGSTYGRLDLESAGTLRASLFATTGSTTLSAATDVLSFDTSGGEAMRIDNSGSVGIGNLNPIASAQRLYIDHPAGTQTALPTVKIRRANNVGGGSALPEIALDVSVPSTYNNATEVYGIKTYAAHNLTGTGCFGIYSEVEKANSDNHHAGFFKGGHSDTNGISKPKVVYIDQTTSVGASNSGYSIGCMIKQDDYTKNEFMRWDTDYSGSDTMNALRIYRNGSQIGGMTTTTSGTTYNTTSDRRLKDNITTITDGTEKLMAMNPVTHGWKADPHTGETVHGFIAQEMQEIVPEAVSGDPDGEEMMSMDYGRITPVLVAALQDAVKEITALKERVAELEAK